MNNKLTVEELQSAKLVTYEIDGFRGEDLDPVRWDDGTIAWQCVRAGHLCGFWTLEGSLEKFDKTGTFEIVPVTDDHLEILIAHTRSWDGGGDTVILVDAKRYEGDFTEPGPGMENFLQEVGK